MREAARARHARGGRAALQVSALWLLERWAQSGHESNAPLAAARVLGFEGNASVPSSASAARWLLERWNGTLIEKQRIAAANVIADYVGAYPLECAQQPGECNGKLLPPIPCPQCAGWTSVEEECV